MEGVILVKAAVSVVTTIWFFLCVTANVCAADLLWGIKAFAWGLGSAVVGYLSDGRVVIKIVFWSIGGVVLFALYKKLVTDKA